LESPPARFWLLSFSGPAVLNKITVLQQIEKLKVYEFET